MKSRKTILCAVLLAAAIIVAYYPAIRSPFQFDDEGGIVMNPALWSLGDLKAVLGYKPELPRPLFNLSMAIDYAIWGLNSTGYHLTNLAIHFLCAVLVWRLAAKLFSMSGIGRAEAAGALSGFVFALNPAASETAIYVWSRSTGMMTLFLLASLVVWIKGIESLDKRRVAIAFVLYLSAMASKEEAVFFPILLVALDLSLYKPEGRRKRLLYSLPFWLAPPALLIIRRAIGSGGVDFVSWRAGMGDDLARMAHERGLAALIPMNFFTQSKVGLEYLRIMLFPFGLSVDHGVNLEAGFPGVGAIFGAVALLCAGLFFLFSRKKFPLAAFLCAFFVSPVILFYFTPISDAMVERRMYFPLAAFAVAVGASFARLSDYRLKTAAVLCVLTSLSFAALTFVRAEMWRDKIVLWSDAVRVSPSKLRPRMTLARYYYESDMSDRAINQNLLVLRIKPDYPTPIQNLGLIYLRKGELEAAEKYFKAAVHLHPRADFNAYYNLGVVYEEMGKIPDAEYNFKKAIEINQGLADAQLKLGLIAAVNHNDMIGSIRYFRAALAVDPGLVEARMNLGSALVDLGMVMEGLGELESAARSAPNNPMVLFNLGMTYLQVGRISEGRSVLSTFMQTARSSDDPNVATMMEQAVGALQSVNAGQPPFR